MPRQPLTRLVLVTLYVGVALALGSCAPDSVRTTGPTAVGDTGWILLSLGPARSPVYVGAYNVVLREKTTGALTSVAFIKDAVFLKETEVDFSDARGEGAVYLVAIPTGEYEVRNYRAALTQHAIEVPPSIPMHVIVAHGQVSYLARFLVQTHWTTKPGIFSEKPIYYALESVSATVVDAYETDIAVARKKFAETFRSIAIAKRPLHAIYQ